MRSDFKGQTDSRYGFTAGIAVFLILHPMKNEFGLFPFIIGTLEVTLLAMLIALPICMLVAIYLSEYARRSFRKLPVLS